MGASRRIDKPLDVESIYVAVVNAIEDATGTSVLGRRPLADFVDPDVLESLVRSRCPGAPLPSRVVFYMCDCEVVVDSRGTVTASHRDGSNESPSPSDPEG